MCHVYDTEILVQSAVKAIFRGQGNKLYVPQVTQLFWVGTRMAMTEIVNVCNYEVVGAWASQVDQLQDSTFAFICLTYVISKDNRQGQFKLDILWHITRSCIACYLVVWSLRCLHIFNSNDSCREYAPCAAAGITIILETNASRDNRRHPSIIKSTSVNMCIPLATLKTNMSLSLFIRN